MTKFQKKNKTYCKMKNLPKQKTQWQASSPCDKIVTKELTSSRLFRKHGMASSKEYLDFVLEHPTAFSLFYYSKRTKNVV